MLKKSAVTTFQVSSFGRLLFLRYLPGIFAIILVNHGWIKTSCFLLLLSSLADLLLESIAARKGWERRDSEIQIEGFADFICFVWAPIQLTLKLSGHSMVVVGIIIFVLAGAFRLSRFNVEGLKNNGYVGMPVTFNGLIFPIICIISFKLGDTTTALLLLGTLILTAILMISNRFIIPRMTI